MLKHKIKKNNKIWYLHRKFTKSHFQQRAPEVDRLSLLIYFTFVFFVCFPPKTIRPPSISSIGLISCHYGRYWRRYWFRNSYWRNSLNNLVLWQRVSAFIKMLRKASLPNIFVKSCKEVPFLLISLFNPPSLTAKFYSQSRLEIGKEDHTDVWLFRFQNIWTNLPADSLTHAGQKGFLMTLRPVGCWRGEGMMWPISSPWHWDTCKFLLKQGCLATSTFHNLSRILSLWESIAICNFFSFSVIQQQ